MAKMTIAEATRIIKVDLRQMIDLVNDIESTTKPKYREISTNHLTELARDIGELAGWLYYETLQ